MLKKNIPTMAIWASFIIPQSARNVAQYFAIFFSHV
jgi:hypothetical protein